MPTIDDSERRSLLSDYFAAAKLGDVSRVGSGDSLFVEPRRANPDRATVLVLGRHDCADLGTPERARIGEAGLIGPGVASQVGPLLAFSEGVQAAAKTTAADNKLNVRFLSLGPNDTLASVPAEILEGIDLAYLTNAVVWSPHQPTITTGSRGEVVAELTLSGGDSINDFIAAGAVRSPLTTLTHILGDLRDSNGRISLDGFYNRATPPSPASRSDLERDHHDPDAWSAHLGLARPGGKLSSLERASLWPTVNVLSVTTDIENDQTAPGRATATVAFYLVPDQRHAEVEYALRSWFMERAPEDLRPAVHMVRSSRPYRCAPDNRAVAAQARAAYRLFNRQPILVPAGGPSGAGEIALALDAPIGFAGIAPPSTSYGGSSESLSWSHFEAGAALAAETCIQLRRR